MAKSPVKMVFGRGFLCHFFESISERLTSNSFQKPSAKSARIDVIGTFWRAQRENCIT